MPDLTKSSPPNKRKRTWLIGAVVAVCAALLLAGLLLWPSGNNPDACPGSNVHMAVTTPDGVAVKPNDSIDGNAGVIVQGSASLPAGCSLFLMDKSGSRYYQTAQVASTTDYRFVDRPVGGVGTNQAVELLLVGVNSSCAAAINDTSVNEGTDSYMTQLPPACTVLQSFWVNAQRDTM